MMMNMKCYNCVYCVYIGLLVILLFLTVKYYICAECQFEPVRLTSINTLEHIHIELQPIKFTYYIKLQTGKLQIQSAETIMAFW